MELFRIELTRRICKAGCCDFWFTSDGDELMSSASLLDNVDGLPEDVEKIDAVFHDGPAANRFEGTIVDEWVDKGLRIHGLETCTRRTTILFNFHELDQILRKLGLQFGKKLWVGIEWHEPRRKVRRTRSRRSRK